MVDHPQQQCKDNYIIIFDYVLFNVKLTLVSFQFSAALVFVILFFPFFDNVIVFIVYLFI